MAEHYATIDDYIAAQPAELRPILQEIRTQIHAAVPDAAEKISYGLPTITRHGHYVVYFAGWKQHVSVYPVPRDENLRKEIAPYLSGKGTLKFPLAPPIPYDLIRRVAAQLAAEGQSGAEARN
jgi:uncharacterized protein YdhG (YjbR/CyaY superfamily)